MLGSRSVTPDWELLTVSKVPERNYRREERKMILGESAKMPERRRIAKVRFKRAELKIHGRAKDVILEKCSFR